MKKYITLAALLVAGTACANAASNPALDLLDASLNPVDLLVNGTDSLTGGNQALTFDLGNKDSLSSYTFTFTLDSVPAGNPETGNAQDAWLRLAKENNSLSNGIRTYSGNLYVASNYNTNASSAFAVTASTASNKVVYSFTFDAVAGTAYVANLSDAETELLSVSGLTASAWTFGSGTARIWTNQGANKISVGNIADLEGYTTEQIKTIAKTGAIPEPSAFGLLAGIGALALVASRRRRK